MSDDLRHSFHRWFRAQVYRDHEQPRLRFVLRNAAHGTRSGEIDEYEIQTGGELDPDHVASVADEILTSAQQDADGAGQSLQSYIVMAVEAGKKTGPRTRFKLRGDGDEDESGEERPDQAGITMQLMRHNEALMRMATMGAQGTINALSRQLEIATTQVAKLNEQRQEAFETLEDAKSRNHERQMALLESGQEQERKNAAFQLAAQKFAQIMPMIMAKLTGAPVPQSTEPTPSPSPTAGSPQIVELLKSFFDQLSPEQLTSIASLLTPAQQAPLLAILQSVQAQPN